MRKRGFTLIEVAIALAIFVVGALAVIRIFPPAFNVVQNSGYSNVATRLSDSVLAQMKGDGSTPQAVFDINEEQGTDNWAAHSNYPIEQYWQDQAGAVVGTANKNDSLPKGPSDVAYRASALAHFRYIRGESHDIQNPAGSDDANDSPYILTNFPYTANDTNGGVRLFVNLKISGVSINQKGRLDFSRARYTNPFTGKGDDFHKSSARPLEILANPGTLGATSNNAVLVFRSPIGNAPFNNTGARFYVSYQYVDGSTGRANSVIDEALALPDDVNWNHEASGNDNVNHVLQGLLHKILPAADQPQIVAGSVQVTARAELVFVAQPMPPVTPDISTVINGIIKLGIDQDYGSRGFVKLPLVYNNNTTPGSLMPRVQISADYLVPGWNILFNQSVSDSAGKVFLPVNLLDPNVVPLGLAANANDNAPAAQLTPTGVDNKHGQVTYADANQTIRTAYQGLDQWVSQISPTATSYVPYIENGVLTDFRDYRPAAAEHYYLPREQWREYFWVAGSNTIYLHGSEAGKTVRVAFIPTTGTQPIQQVLTVDNDVIDPGTGTIPAGYASTGTVAALQLKDGNGNAIAASGILSVRGVGIVARTAWLNGDKYEQSVVTGYRVER